MKRISRELGKAEAREKAEEELEQAKAALAACGEKLAAAERRLKTERETGAGGEKRLQEEPSASGRNCRVIRSWRKKERLLRETKKELTDGRNAQGRLEEKQEKQARLLAGTEGRAGEKAGERW